MLELINKKNGKKRVMVWFPKDNYTTKIRCDVCCYIGITQLHNKKNSHIKFTTLVHNLTLPYESIESQFAKVNRYDIRRSARDMIEVSIVESKNIISDNSLLLKFKEVYEKMYSLKGMIQKAPIDAMKFYANNNALIISCVEFQEKPIVYHAYIIDGENARLWMSCSVFRDSEDKQYRALVGRANKRLHSDDIQYFKNNGYSSYDWGGISSLNEPNGIDRFKMSFGGTPIQYYDETVLMSLKYRVFSKIIRLFTH